jgi:hypothetical protein
MRFKSVLIIAIVIACAFVAAFFYRAVPADRARPVISLEKMGQLVSLRMHYAEVIAFDQKKSLDILGVGAVKYGGTRILLIAKGDCTIGTDLTVARLARPASVAGDAVPTVDITLPLPAPLQFRINHAAPDKGGSYLYAVDNIGIEAILPDAKGRTDAVNRAMTAAQDRVRQACSQPDVVDSARKNAETVLGALLTANRERPVFHWK